MTPFRIHLNKLFNYFTALQYVYGAHPGYVECRKKGSRYSEMCVQVGITITLSAMKKWYNRPSLGARRPSSIVCRP